MENLPHIRPGIKPGCLDHRPPISKRAGDPQKLDGADRRAWERSILDTPGLKGSRLHLARVLLDEFCWGKCSCYPGDELLARKVGVGTATVGRALRDLVQLGVIRIVRARSRRWIVFPSHPHAADFLAGFEPTATAPGAPEAPVLIGPAPAAPTADHPDGPTDHPVVPAPQIERPADQFDWRSVVVKLGEEARPEPAPACEGNPEMSLSGPNGLTTEGEPTMPKPSPDLAPSLPTRRQLRGIPDLAGAPIDDPIIVAELARRNRATETAAPPSPAERAALQAEVLDGIVRGRAGPADGPEAGPPPDPAAGGHPGGPEGAPDRSTAAVAEAATIEALSKLGPGATRGEVLAATLRLAALFRDPGSRAYYRSVCNDVAAGRLPARVPIAAVGSARRPGVRNPGAAFTAHVRRCEATAARRAADAVGSKDPAAGRGTSTMGG